MGPNDETELKKNMGEDRYRLNLMAITRVNKHASEASAVHEELYFRLNIVKLRNPRGNLAVVVPPPS